MLYPELFSRPLRENGFTTIAFLGDSITQGCFQYEATGPLTDRDPISAYHHQLFLMLAEKYSRPVNIINAGVGGDNATMGLARIDRDVIDRHPDICFVCFGANDAWGADTVEFEQSMRSIIARLSENHIHTVLMTQQHMVKNVSPDTHPELLEIAKNMAAIQNNGHVAKFYAVTRALAKEFDLPLVDVWAEYDRMEKEGIDTDALLANHINHPTREAHRDIFARLIFETIFN